MAVFTEEQMAAIKEQLLDDDSVILIKTENRLISEAVQLVLFDLGCHWCIGNRVIRNSDTDYLVVRNRHSIYYTNTPTRTCVGEYTLQIDNAGCIYDGNGVLTELRALIKCGLEGINELNMNHDYLIIGFIGGKRVEYRLNKYTNKVSIKELYTD